MSSETNVPELPPHARVVEMTTGFMVFRAIYVAAKLGLADLLKDGARGVDELAEATKTRPTTLYRLMRMLAGVGFFREVSPRSFENAELGEALRADHPGMARATALFMGGAASWSAWEALERSVATGQSGFSLANGAGMFDYLGEHADEAQYFNDMMIGFHGAEPAAIAQVFDTNGIERLVDVGGGTGNLMTTLLKANPRLRGTLHDLEHVTEEAKKRIASLGLEDRCDVSSGSFFDDVPAGDAYVISHIIHDWDDASCVKILGNCKRANPDAAVNVVEFVIPDGDEMHLSKLADIIMMVHTEGGQERTEKEYGDLFAAAGYRLDRIIPTETPVSVVVAAPA